MSKRSQRLKKLNEIEQDLRKRALPTMTTRGDVEVELQQIDREFREVAIAYEQYFMGVDKFEPAKERQILSLRLRRLLTSYIPQTDLRFRLQGLASRLQSYIAYWDRILRLIEEGRYQRQHSHMKWAAQHRPPDPGEAHPPAKAPEPHDQVYRELVEAYTRCRLAPPQREQIDEFLKRQAEVIRERFGERPIEMTVVVEGDKPKLRVRAKD
jgi:hypothetical protein